MEVERVEGEKEEERREEAEEVTRTEARSVGGEVETAGLESWEGG